MTKQRLLATLATLLKVYIERGIIIPELEKDLKDGAVKEIRDAIEKKKPSRKVVIEWREKKRRNHDDVCNNKN